MPTIRPPSSPLKNLSKSYNKLLKQDALSVIVRQAKFTFKIKSKAVYISKNI